MQVRYEIATHRLSSWADYKAADKMIGNGKNIAKFVEDLTQRRDPCAARICHAARGEAKNRSGGERISGYDAFHLIEMVRRSQYDFDSQTVRPYLPFNQVKQGSWTRPRRCST